MSAANLKLGEKKTKNSWPGLALSEQTLKSLQYCLPKQLRQGSILSLQIIVTGAGETVATNLSRAWLEEQSYLQKMECRYAHTEICPLMVRKLRLKKGKACSKP